MAFSSRTPTAKLPVFSYDDKPSWQDVNAGNLLVDRFLRNLKASIDTIANTGTGPGNGVPKLLFTSHDVAPGGTSTVTVKEVPNGYLIDLGLVLPHDGIHEWSEIIGKPSFADVATSGSYIDLTDKPALAPVATAGTYASLTGKPAFATVATSGLYADLAGKPILKAIATSGLYSDLTGAPSLAAIATTGSWMDIVGKPTIPVNGTWQSITTFAAGWAAYGSATYGTPSVLKSMDNIVHARGLANRASGTSTIIFTMPVGYRPLYPVNLPAISADAFCELIINPDGTVNLSGGTPATWVSFAPIHYLAEQ
jgi:hypothetical protein